MRIILGASQTLAVVASDVALVVEWLLAPVVGWLLMHMWVCSPAAVRIGVLVDFFVVQGSTHTCIYVRNDGTWNNS